jgi:hypothetical protein
VSGWRGFLARSQVRRNGGRTQEEGQPTRRRKMKKKEE